jgi:hypothetical protein
MITVGFSDVIYSRPKIWIREAHHDHAAGRDVIVCVQQDDGTYGSRRLLDLAHAATRGSNL